jgi:hypothetical protein
MHTPRTNYFIFGFYFLLVSSILVASLAVPGMRSNRLLAAAPLRDLVLDLVLPKPDPIVISILYSTEKQAWLTEAVKDFEAGNPVLDGHPIQIQLEEMGSREIYLAVLDGTRKPDVISPASMLQISILQDLSTSKFGSPVVNMADKTACRSVVTTPLVVVAWKARADVLWGDNPNSHMWKRLHDALVDPKGWSSYGHPEWGYIKFGHTDPLRSNSGFMTILLMTYNFLGKTSGLTSNDILSNTDYQQWFLDTENTISQFEYSTGPLMQKMVTYGPSTYDIVAVYEATAIGQAANAVGRYGELRIYYPPATVWSDHPFCILNADWVSPQKSQAAQVFIDYLLSKPAQTSALLDYGFRPVDKSIPLDQPGSPFEKFVTNGLKSDLSGLPTVDVPDGGVLNTLQEFWSRNIKKGKE